MCRPMPRPGNTAPDNDAARLNSTERVADSGAGFLALALREGRRRTLTPSSSPR